MHKDFLYGLISSFMGDNKYSVYDLPDSVLEKLYDRANKKLLVRASNIDIFVPLFLSYTAKSLFSKISFSSIEELVFLKERILSLKFH